MIRLVALLFISSCASSPYVDFRMEQQIDGMSDWVLQPERPWTADESEVHVNLRVGLEWSKGLKCPYVDSMIVGPWNQVFVGCSKSFQTEKRRFYIEPAIVHQIDSQTSGFLGTDQKQWQGHNPFIHLRVGVNINPAFYCGVSSGKSLFQGAPFESESNNPDLYWTNVGCGARLFGKTGLFSKEHLR